ncbi:hypothetical protein [Microbacterium sp.]|uniref:hypothetical protein n=1 Tax=Microbacterium sp. TaxID=51671 RepID=UPI002C5151DE|nr:hypothetical protein [Microbacterium sp.]HWL79241.1 hypothetical protein [Microbacterium sp.]
MADGLESFTVNGRCPRDRNYRLDLVELARRIGQPTVILTAQHADRIDIRPFRADMD